MSKRAALRREQKAKKKANKLLGTRGELERISCQAMEDGRRFAFVSIYSCLIEHFRFGRRRCEQFSERVRKESSKLEQDGVSFVIKWYIDKVQKALEQEKFFVSSQNPKEHIYLCQREEQFTIAVAIMLATLQEMYGFSFQQTKIGRLNFCLNWCVEKYTKYFSDIEAFQWEKHKIEEKLHVNV